MAAICQGSCFEESEEIMTVFNLGNRTLSSIEDSKHIHEDRTKGCEDVSIKQGKK
jgi:hypothetical protein